MFFTGIWNVTTTLIPLLPTHDVSPHRSQPHQTQQEATDLFTRACALIPILERDYPIVWPVMQGVLALACKTGKVVSSEARDYFEGMTQRRENLKDLPIAFALPVQDRLLEVGGEEGEGRFGVDLAELLQDWEGLDG